MLARLGFREFDICGFSQDPAVIGTLIPAQPPSWMTKCTNIGTLIIRIGFGGYYTLIIIRNPKTLF